MKKWMKIEIVLLALVLVAAIIACTNLSRQTIAPVEDPVETVPETTEAIPTETTEPQPTWMTFPADRALTAQQAFVYDCQTREFTYLKGQADDKVYPASITKLFTAYVAMQHLSAEDQVTVGDELDMIDWDSTVAQLQKGDALTVKELVGGDHRLWRPHG